MLLVNWLDIVIMIIFVGAIVGGLGRGIIKQGISLAAILVSVFVAGQTYDVPGRFLTRFTADANLSNLLGFAIGFVVISIATGIVVDRVPARKKRIALGGLDRFVAALLGLAVGAVLVTTFLIALLTFPYAGLNVAADEARFGPILINNFGFVLNLLPKGFQAARGLLGG